jgi:hypothetical protein
LHRASDPDPAAGGKIPGSQTHEGITPMTVSSTPPASAPVQHAPPPAVRKDDGDHDNDATESKAAAAAEKNRTRTLDITA